jgi:predicted amidophosphoribosyltransferase
MQDAATLATLVVGRLRQIGRAVVNGVLPPRCLACGEIVGTPDALCGKCWRRITFFAPPWCTVCGAPFDHPMGENAVCGGCAGSRHSWDCARAVLRYDKHSRSLVLGLKHGDRTHLARAFGRWMHRAGADVLAETDLLVPVPLHWSRLFRRRFNQAALLAHTIHAVGGPNVAADWLVRRRRTPPQGHLGPTARERNVRGAFAVRAGRSFAGTRVGATVEECARVLRRAGAVSVGVLVLARALRAGD